MTSHCSFRKSFEILNELTDIHENCTTERALQYGISVVISNKMAGVLNYGVRARAAKLNLRVGNTARQWNFAKHSGFVQVTSWWNMK
jgi:hypothetical protein